MQRSIRASAAVLATGLVLAACGTASDTDSGAAPTTEAATARASEPELIPTDAPAESSGASSDSEPATGNEPAPTDGAAEAPPQTAASAPAAPPAEAVLGGRAFASELATGSDFAENLLPDLQVDDIRSGQKVNVRNVFPAARPVLMWMWAPH